MSKETENQHVSSIDGPRSLFMGRRSFVKGVASMGAGIAASALLPEASRGQASPAAPEADSSPGPRSKGDVVASDAATVVEIASGKIRGVRRKGIFTFKGVPYGASTSGPNRFMGPVPPEPWPGIRNALAFGRACYQETAQSKAGGPHSTFDGRNLALSDEDNFLLHRGCAIYTPGEDCLRLNVWTPEINGNGKRPVMVYMHGGGFEAGFDIDLLSYDGENLARNHDVVVVTHNHRLNVFGYLNLAEIGGEKVADSANAGMLDIVAVLKWVRDNIARFGGNPGNVTIFGQSGGGGKVVTLMAMPSAKGLFHKAICQSGPFLKAGEPDYTAQVAAEVIKELGLTKPQVDDLQKIGVERLFGAARTVMDRLNPRTSFNLNRPIGLKGWGPYVDGQILPYHPFDPAAPPESADVPLISGTILNEVVSGLDHGSLVAMTNAELHRKAREELGDKGDAVIAAYRGDYPQATPFGIYAAIWAEPFRRPAAEQCLRKAAQRAAPAYSYIYGWRTPMLDDRPGTFHACEIGFAFDNAELCNHYSGMQPEALALSKQMSGAWASFARTGNPNHPGLPEWPAYSAERRSTMFFDAPSRVRNAPEAEGLRLLAQA